MECRLISRLILESELLRTGLGGCWEYMICMGVDMDKSYS